jgi:hypothetical protein
MRYPPTLLRLASFHLFPSLSLFFSLFSPSVPGRRYEVYSHPPPSSLWSLVVGGGYAPRLPSFLWSLSLSFPLFPSLLPYFPRGRASCQTCFGFVAHKSQNKGLISVDRGTKATLARTIPCSFIKSYTIDSFLLIFELVIQHRLKSRLMQQQGRYNVMILSRKGYCYSCNIVEERRIAAFQHGFGLRGVQP